VRAKWTDKTVNKTPKPETKFAAIGSIKNLYFGYANNFKLSDK